MCTSPAWTRWLFETALCMCREASSEMKLAEAPSDMPAVLRLFRWFRQRTHGRKPVHMVPSHEPFIRAVARQRPVRGVLRNPLIGPEVVFLQLALLLVDE